MKRCPACGRTFTNNTLTDCLNDGTPLVEDAPSPPPYFGAPPAAATPPPITAEPPSTAEPPDAPGTVTYTNTPLSAIPELQSPEMQAALKEALDKAGMSSLFGADLPGKSTISVTTSATTNSHSATPFAAPGTSPPGYAGTPPPSPYYAGTQAPRRKRSPWGGLLITALVVFAVAGGLRYIVHQVALSTGTTASVPADITAAVKNADDAEVKAVSSLNPAPLYSAYTGPALARELSEMDALKAARRSQADHLTAQKFSAFHKSVDGSEAQVDVTETWDTVIYAEPGHTVVSRRSGVVNPQTIMLKHTPKGWRVENIEFHHS